MQISEILIKPKPRFFLTGGSGYVGRNLVRHFIAKGFEVVALARSERSLQIVKALGAVPFAGDLLDAGLVEGMKDCQTLINAAADTDHGRGTAQQSQTNLERHAEFISIRSHGRNIESCAYQHRIGIVGWWTADQRNGRPSFSAEIGGLLFVYER